MSFPLTNILVVALGALMATIGAILLWAAAFRESLVWGLVTVLAPFGKISFAVRHWAEARTGLLLNLLGTAICLGGLRSIPDFKERLWQLKSPTLTAHAPTVAEIDSQILQHRQQLESLQATFAQEGAELMKQYQALDAQRKALKPADTEAITKFNALAAAYQARNVHHKETQQAMESGQKELDAMLDNRARAVVANSRKVVMYTTSHCPACKAAKQYLAQKGVSYEEIDVEHSPDGAQAFQKLGGRGVPLILVGDKKMEGFSPQALDALL